MGIGIPFDEANDILRAPTPEDAAAGTVYDLHIHRYRDLDRQPNVISKWQLTPGEMADVIATGAVWFNCWGHTHPPIWISGHNPFAHIQVGPIVKAAAPLPLSDVTPAGATGPLDPSDSAERFVRIVASCDPGTPSALDRAIIDVARRISEAFDAKAAA